MLWPLLLDTTMAAATVRYVWISAACSTIQVTVSLILQDAWGIHHFVAPAVLEAPMGQQTVNVDMPSFNSSLLVIPGSNSYGVCRVFGDRIELDGVGVMPTKKLVYERTHEPRPAASAALG